MKKLLSILLLTVLVLSVSLTPVYAAPQDHSITMQEFNDLLTKYGIQAKAIDSESLSSESVKNNLTKNELESLIIEGLKETSEPVVINKAMGTIKYPVMPNGSTLTNTLDNSSGALSAAYGTWEVAYRSAALTASSTFNNMNVVVNAAASYQYEYYNAPGTSTTRNWKFTSATAGSVVNSSNAYSIDSCQKDISYTNSTVTESISLTYTYYLTIDVEGFPFKIPFSNGAASATYYWYISSYQF